MILFFEFLGTAMVTCLWNNSIGSAFPIFISFFIVLIMGANISGSHFNPAVTLAFMFRKDNGRFRRLLGLLYIAAQFAGGIFGAVISYTLFQSQKEIGITNLNPNNWNNQVTFYWSQGMFAEAFGSCLLIFIYLTQTEASTRLANDPAITMLIISASYVVSMSLCRFHSISPLNPAVAAGLLGAEIVSSKYIFQWGFVLCTFPFLGGILGLILFECLYKKTAGAVKDVDDDEGANDGQAYQGGPSYNDNPYADQEPLI
jgi:glycerol uptake facilitator-like aquaporin